MVKYLILGVFLLVMVAVGIWSNKQVKTADDFIIGGRRMGPWLSAFSYGTTYFSAVIFVGYAGRFGWGMGLSATWIGIGNAVIGSLLAWLLLAERTRKISTAMQAATMADYFKKRYDSVGLEKFSAIIIFVFLLPYSASVYQGLGYILQVFFKGTFLESTTYSMLLVALITAVYLFFGGYVSTAINSLIQGVIMLVGVIYMVIVVLGKVGGLASGIQILGGINGNLVTAGGPTPFNMIILLLMTSVGTFGLPQMISKYHSIRDAKATHRGMIMSTVFALIIGGGAYFMGGMSQALNSKLGLGLEGVKNLDTVMPKVFETILSPEMLSLLVILMLSASMSTLAGVVLVSAPTFSRSILKNDKMLALRLMSLVFVLVSYLIAVIPSAIVTLMAFSWGAVSGAFIGPYIWGLYMKKMTRAGAMIGMICGLATVVVGAAVLLVVNPAGATKFAPQLAVLAMAISTVVTPLASLLTAKTSPIPEGAKYL
jgi:solute:Na+ symporter, SSS family